MTSKIHYEARLNRNIRRLVYGGRKTYKKGTVIYECSEKQFEKLTPENIWKETNLSFCEGHGIYEYFDLEKDIEFFKVETLTKIKQKLVKLKK